VNIPLCKRDHLYAISGHIICKTDTAEWLEWLQNNDSFRFEDNMQYNSELGTLTARKEKSGYWYGYRKIYGKLQKKYIGKSEQCTAKRLKSIADGLEAICMELMNAPKAASPKVAYSATDTIVTDAVTQDRITELETRLQAIEERLGKLRA